MNFILIGKKISLKIDLIIKQQKYLDQSEVGSKVARLTTSLLNRTCLNTKRASTLKTGVALKMHNYVKICQGLEEKNAGSLDLQALCSD